MVATALAEFGRLDGLVNLAYAHEAPRHSPNCRPTR